MPKKNKSKKNAIPDELFQLISKDGLTQDEVNFIQGMNVPQNPEYANEGLPNIGNTCFLNSVLQLLFSSANFRNALMEDSQNNIESTIASLFKLIKQCDPSSQLKEKKLRTLVKLLQFAHPQYSLQSQQDSTEFLLLIINEISQTKPEITKIFQLEYDYWCECPTANAAHFKELYLSENQATCATCQKSTQIMLMDCPKDLIFIGKNNDTFNKYKKKQFNEGKVEYGFSSAVLYSGNGRSGHYTSFRRAKDGEFYLFNDEYVSKKDQIWGVPLISIYQKTKEQMVRREEQALINQKRIYKTNIDVIQKIMPKNKRKIFVKRSLFYVIKCRKQELTKGQYSVVVLLSNSCNYQILKEAKIRTEMKVSKEQAYINQEKGQGIAKCAEMKFMIKNEKEEKNLTHKFILDNVERRFQEWFEKDDDFTSDKAKFYKKDYDRSQIRYQTAKGTYIYKVEEKTPTPN